MSELDLVLFFRSTLVSLTVYTQKFHKNQKVEFGSITHMLHVWHIYLHLAYKCGKCR